MLWLGVANLRENRSIFFELYSARPCLGWRQKLKKSEREKRQLQQPQHEEKEEKEKEKEEEVDYAIGSKRRMLADHYTWITFEEVGRLSLQFGTGLHDLISTVRITPSSLSLTHSLSYSLSLTLT